ncbi:MAG TPA: TRAP transporter fused permease subunit [Sphingomicrobium sp.]|nr:TRAP transporter fused permease subunit [Sphingomicrobium sp.]
MVNLLLAVVAAAMVLFHMVSTQVFLMTAYQFQDVHLAFIFTLIFLAALRGGSVWLQALATLCLLLGLACVVYVYLNVDQLQIDAGFPDTMEMIVGIVLILLVLEATRRAWGWLLPSVAVIAILYYQFGSTMLGPFRHPPYGTDYIVSDLSIGLSGIYGMFLSISANQVFLFVVFGALLSVTKVSDLFFELGKATGRVFRGGPAQTAVISSSLIGMVSGAAVANVATVGSITIPYMKRVGFSPEMAGAIEANASTGGQIMPPVMGASAFLMATFVGVPYKTVMLAGIIPAILFYWACVLGVQFFSVLNGIGDAREQIDWPIVYRRGLLFVIPLGLLIGLLLMRYSPSYAAFWAIVVSFVLSLLRKDTRPSPRDFLAAITEGAITGARIGITLAVVGIIARTIVTTGLGAKLAGVVDFLSAGHLGIALVLTMLVSLILGMGIPTTAAYSLVAIIVVPSLVGMGAGLLQAHFFAFYFAVVSALTPPVALASLTASGIAGGDYVKTSLNAFKLGIPAFVIPYLIIYNSEMIWQFRGGAMDILSLIVILVAVTTSTAFMFNCFFIRLTFLERIATGTGSLALYAFVFVDAAHLDRYGLALLCLGIVLLGVVALNQMKRLKVNRPAPSLQAS